MIHPSSSSDRAFLGLLALVALWRLVEVVISWRNLAWSQARGGFEVGRGHFPFMVVLHVGLIAGSAVEVLVARRPFVPAVAVALVALLVATQAVRVWCMVVLGRAWNTRIVVVPGSPRVRRGPYRLLAHPNYVVVAIEGVALPLVHGAVVTAAAFSVANAIFLLTVRIPAEDAALARLADVGAPTGPRVSRIGNEAPGA